MPESVEATKASFFDREAVLKAVDKAVAKAMSRFGAFVRQRAKTSIRYRNDPAPPGSPPSAHRTGMKLVKPRKSGRPGQTPSGKRQMSSPLRDFIFFAYDRDKQTVVIGPAKTNQAAPRKFLPLGMATVPQVIEEGGTLTGGARGPITIRPHPSMKPARDAELPGFLESLKDSIGG